MPDTYHTAGLRRGPPPQLLRRPGQPPLARDYRIRIEVKVVHRKRWIQLVTFTLRAAHVTDPERYITYSNSAHDLTEETVRESKAALEQLISRLQAQP
jgi:hypothetical protein